MEFRAGRPKLDASQYTLVRARFVSDTSIEPRTVNLLDNTRFMYIPRFMCCQQRVWWRPSCFRALAAHHVCAAAPAARTTLSAAAAAASTAAARTATCSTPSELHPPRLSPDATGVTWVLAYSLPLCPQLLCCVHMAVASGRQRTQWLRVLWR